MKREDFVENIAPGLPVKPGCYMFLDEDKNVLYVGKSKCLKKRVASYFGANKFEKFNVMLRFAKCIEVEETGTDIEALLLEHKLIKKHKPQYNSKMRKDMPRWYIVIEDGVTIVQNTDLPGFYAGPFFHKESAMEALEILGKSFLIPTCLGKSARMCLRGHTKNCFAPCESIIPGFDNYQQAIRFLQGFGDEILVELHMKMQKAVESMDYEQAAKFKTQYDGLKYLSGFAAHRIPILSQKRFAVFLKSRHDDCFMLAYLNDGRCFERVMLDNAKSSLLFDFAKKIPGSANVIEDSDAFLSALAEISAIKRFCELDTEVTCINKLLDKIKELIR